MASVAAAASWRSCMLSLPGTRCATLGITKSFGAYDAGLSGCFLFTTTHRLDGAVVEWVVLSNTAGCSAWGGVVDDESVLLLGDAGALEVFHTRKAEPTTTIRATAIITLLFIQAS